MTPLNRLSEETRAKLRSTQVLTSLPQIVSELLQNSIDSGASQIDVGVDCENWSCWVRDDGSGFSKDGLAEIARGSEDGRYMSSKAHTPASLESISTFGFRGEALSSVADLCCMEISSRTARSRESWSVILKGGQALYNGPSNQWRRESAGTVVSVRDAFFNLPIRRLSHPSSNKVIETIQKEIESYALVFPGIAFSLQDTSKYNEGGSKQSHILKIPRTRSTLAAFRHLYGRAFTEHVEEIDSVSGETKIDGFVSLVGAHTKAYQFLYINRHPISYCDLHKLIDLRFSSSSFAKHAYDEEGETTLRPGIRRSPLKGEKKPVYVLNLTIPPRHIDNCLEPAKTAVLLDNKDVVTSFLSSLIQLFLVRHEFAPREADKNIDGNASKKRQKLTEVPSITEPSTLSNDPLLFMPRSYGGCGASPLFIRPTEISEGAVKDSPNGETFVTDQGMGNSHPQIVSRSVSADAPIGTSPRDSVPRGPRPTSEKIVSKEGENTFETGDVPGWLKEALSANNVFANKEPRIPTLPLSLNQSANDRSYFDNLHSCHTHPGEHLNSSYYLQPNASNSAVSYTRFRKEDLQNACVIRQVDQKFVACLIGADHRLPGTSEELYEGNAGHTNSKILVLIDQHAADERVRVERFLKIICNGFLCHHDGSGGVEITKLSPPVPVLLTYHEAARLSHVLAYQRAFESWGLHFDGLPSTPIAKGPEPNGNGDAAYVQILVTSVPEIVSERLLSGNQLQELIRSHLAALENEPGCFDVPSQLNTGACDRETRWTKALRWCPRVLLDLINSKACRGAIMFNDPLNHEQCQRLTKQLSVTAFPFQCAHGRPSLVPLIHLDSQNAARRSSAVEWERVAML